MNTENYRLIPNEEYERLVGLANLHEKAIQEVIGKALSENEEEYKTVFNTIRELRRKVVNIGSQLDDIVDFCKPYYSRYHVHESITRLMDEYIKEINRWDTLKV